MKHVITCTAAALALAGCSQKHAAEEAVRQSLKDPDSAKFGNFYFNEKTQKGCVTVNAKNSMGGYTGNQQSYVRRTKDGWEAYELAAVDQSMCREVFADSKD